MKLILYPLLIHLSVSAVANSIPQDLLEQLDSEIYDQRANAHAQLEHWIRNANKNEVEELKAFSEQSTSPEVKSRLKDIIAEAYIAIPNTRGFIGISMNSILGGAKITRIEPGQPAAKAGLKVGDVILKVDNKDLTRMKGSESHAMQFLQGYVKKQNEGERLQLKIRREEKFLHIDIKLGNLDKYMAKQKSPRVIK